MSGIVISDKRKKLLDLFDACQDAYEALLDAQRELEEAVADERHCRERYAKAKSDWNDAVKNDGPGTFPSPATFEEGGGK